MGTEQDLIKKYTIEDLSELTGFSRRTIRFYIQENIIDPPAGRGRGGFYFDSHLNALIKIKELQDKGLNLEAIKNILKRAVIGIDLDALITEEKVNRQSWAKYEISDGIELSIRKDIEIKNNKKINEIIRLLTINAKEIQND
jgi:DNA-binding transcriptional MerR regulator